MKWLVSLRISGGRVAENRAIWMSPGRNLKML
jgi:hypothetical protein